MTKTSFTIRAQLVIAFGAMTLLMGAVTAVALHALTVENDRFVGFVNGISARANLAAGVRTAVDRRAIAARNLVILTSPAAIEVERKEVLQAHDDVQTQLTTLTKMAQAPEVAEKARAMIAEIERVESAYGPVALKIVDMALKGERAEAARRIEVECRPLLAALVKASSVYLEATNEHGQVLVAEAGEMHSAMVIQLGALCALAMLGALGLGAYIVHRLGRALGAEPAALGEAARRVAEGDLAVIPGLDRAHAGSVLASLAHMQQSLSTTVRAVREASDSIATGSSQIATGNADLSQRTEQQASSLQQTSATMGQLGETVKSNAANASRADRLAGEAAQIAIRGGQVVDEVVETMKRISDGSRRIAEITGLIDGIAFQTNILALNAAVEAARAGEEGRGFAVVATEVRSLAQRSANAAREIKNLIGASDQQVTQGTELVDRAGATMGEIVTSVQQVKDIVEKISAASAEQSDGVSQVGSAVGQIDQATQQNAALVEQSAAAAESLREQAVALVASVATFKLAA